MLNYRLTILFLFAFFLIVNVANAQNFIGLQDVEMEELEDYEAREGLVLDCADFLLEQPFDEFERDRARCAAFLIRWMEGTDIKFVLGDDFVKLSDGSEESLPVYLAALVKAALSDEKTAEDSDRINEEARELFLDYCADESHNLKPNRYTRKLLKQRD